MEIGIKIIDLNSENIVDCPEWRSFPFSCKYCIWWETAEEYGESSKMSNTARLKIKREWISKVSKSFGVCGKILYVDENPIGYAQYAPSTYLPRSKDYLTGPPSKDAVLIACLFIYNESYRGLGLGKQLLENIIIELREKGVKAVETFPRRGSPDNPSGPLAFYIKNGFKILRDDDEFPLVRLNL